jgi:hypothetical protein
MSTYTSRVYEYCSKSAFDQQNARIYFNFRYLITGSDFVDLSISFNLGISTIHKIIHETTKKIRETLFDIVLAYPTERTYEKISKDFWSRWNMPNCVGALDGKHIAIRAPPNSGSAFFNFKGHFSIVLMAICDASYCFTMVDVGQYGSVSDGGVFKDSLLGKRILEEDGNLPRHPTKLPNSERETDIFFVADQAFPLNKRIMRPYPGQNLTDSELIFNYRLSRARGIIENTFGIFSRRFKLFEGSIMLYDINGVCDVVMAAICLHNFIQRRRNAKSEGDTPTPNGFVSEGPLSPVLEPPGVPEEPSARYAYTQRETLTQFFLEDDSCPWQHDYIRRGCNRE